MEIRVLRYFLEVARELNITAAANTLHITQPTLSKQLMDLEDELGKKLFIRGKRRITLTDDGILLRKRASEILELVEKTESELQNSDEITIGDIYIGVAETQGMEFIAKICKNLQQNFPQIHYHFFSGNSEDVLEKLDKGLIDFGILLQPFDMTKYDYINLPSIDIWGLLMRNDSPLASLDFIQPENIKNIPLILSRQSLNNNEIARWFGEPIDSLNIVATYNLIYNASFLVQEGFGSALTIDKLVHLSDDNNLCFKPLSPKLESSLVMVWKKSQVFSKPAQKFFNEIKSNL